MIELDDATRRALLVRDGPPSHARAEVLANLRVRLGGPVGPDGGGGEGLPTRGDGPLPGSDLATTASTGARVAWAAKVAGATLGLTSAGLLTLKLGALALAPGGPVTDQPSHGATRDPVEARAASPEPAGGPAPPPPAPSPALSPTASPDPSPDPSKVGAGPTVPPRATNGTSPHSSSVGGSKPAQPPGSTLADELAMVREAKRLFDRDPEQALAQLDRHAERFEAGVLAPEREALRIELLCASGHPDEATALQASFTRRFPDSPLRGRVLAACEEAP